TWLLVSTWPPLVSSIPEPAACPPASRVVMSTSPVVTLDGVVVPGALVDGVVNSGGAEGNVAEGAVVSGEPGSDVAGPGDGVSSAGGVVVAAGAALSDDAFRKRALPMATPPTNERATT